MIEEIIINRSSKINWEYDIETNEYIITVRVYNREIYHKRFDKKHYEVFHFYINERIKYLIGEGILNKNYSMILLDNTMYKVLDGFHFMELMRILVPVDGLERNKIEDNLFDMVINATLRTGEIFDEKDLVYHNGAFYTNGIRLADINDFKREGIDYEEYDLLNGLNEEQKDYLFYRIYNSLDCNRIEYYVTEKVKLKIDR